MSLDPDVPGSVPWKACRDCGVVPGGCPLKPCLREAGNGGSVGLEVRQTWLPTLSLVPCTCWLDVV